MAEQNANAVAITGGTATLTSVTTPTVQATNSAGLSLKNSGGTTQISMGAGGGDNISLNSSTNINGTNAQIDISPTGTGHVHIKPTGVNSVEIAPTYVGEMDNITIGSITPKAGTFTTITGQTEVLKGTGQNFLTQSSVLTNAAWSQGNVTVTGSQSDPLGGTTAILMDDGTANAQHLIQQNYTTANTLTYTYSFYAKAGTANYIGIGTYQSANYGIIVNLTNGTFSANITNAPASYAITSVGSGWYRCSITINSVQAASSAFYIIMSENGTSTSFTGTNKTVYVAAPQLELGSTANTYIPTTTTAIYGTPTLSFSGVAGLGLESNGSLYVSPAGTGALQAQATTSTTAGGNARGQYAVDWQTARTAASQVASNAYSSIAGGVANTASGYNSSVGSGYLNTASGYVSFVGGGIGNLSGSRDYSVAVGGAYNTSAGVYNFVGGGYVNSGTASAAVTTQSGTMNATTAVTLSGSNASIKVGQYITGTSIAGDTYVAAISGTSLTLSKVASGSSTSTLSFYTPHGVVVGGGNNQATGSYSFIGGGGDAGTAANRNVASGDWGSVTGGFKNTASGVYSFVGGGATNVASNVGSVVCGGGAFGVGGFLNNISSSLSSFVGAGVGSTANGSYSFISAGTFGTTRGIDANHVFPAINNAFGAGAQGSAQSALLILARQTTDATPTALASSTSAAGSTNQVILPNNSAYFFRGEVVSGVTGGGDTKGWTIEGVIKRGAGVGTTALVGTPTVTSSFADAGASTWTIAVTADTTNGGLRVTFTGQAATTIRTVCQIRTTEMTY
jgi:hypothetical protein